MKVWMRAMGHHRASLGKGGLNGQRHHLHHHHHHDHHHKAKVNSES